MTSNPVTSAGLLKLTKDETDYLQSFIDANDRGGYYLALYNMTGVTQILVQAEISTFSQYAGAAAYVANMLMYRNLPEYGQGVASDGNGRDTVDAFSNYIAQTDLNVIMLYRDGYDENGLPLSFESTGYLNDRQTLDLAILAWKNKNIPLLFPGNLLDAQYYGLDGALSYIANSAEKIGLTTADALKQFVESYIGYKAALNGEAFSFDKFLEKLLTTGSGFAILGVLAGPFMGKKLEDFEGKAGYKIVELPDAAYKVAIDTTTNIVAGIFRNEFIPDTLASIEATLAGYWPAIVGALGGGVIGSITAQFITSILNDVVTVFKEKYLMQPGPYSIMPERTGYGDVAYSVNSAGTANNDTLWGEGGMISFIHNDAINGGAGNDRIFGGDGGDTLHGDSGDDILYGQKDDDHLYGDAGKDLLRGGAGDDYLDGGTEDDTLDGGDITGAASGNDTLVGGLGNDLLTGADGDDKLYGDAETNTSTLQDGSDKLYGGLGNDELYSGGGNDYLEGGAGDDTLTGGTGSDELYGGAGSDTYIFSTTDNYGTDTLLDSDGSGNIVIDGVTLRGGTQLNPNLWKSADGAYRISILPNPDSTATTQTLIISKADDLQNSITVKSWKNGDLGINLVKAPTPEAPTNTDTANNGNNIIINRSTVFALGGNDYILATSNNDYLYGDDGNDLINAQDGSDIVDGGAGNDIIFGGQGRDTIFGKDGNDLIFSSATLSLSKSELEQRIGSPTSGLTDLDQTYADIDYYINPDYSTETSSYAYYIDFGSGVTTTLLPIIGHGYASHDRYYPFVNYYGSLNNGAGFAGEDAVYGGAGNDFILGSKDSDVLDGGDDDDNLFGLNGNDFLFGGNGKDSVYGGDGLDIIHGGDQDDEVLGGYDKDIIYGDAGNDNIQGDLNNLFGTNAPPGTVDYARYGNDELYGGAGNDNIYGNGGSDTIHGDDGDDGIRGDLSNLPGQYHKGDVLYGDAGNDSISGQGGADAIYGGTDDDQIMGDDLDLAIAYHGNDTIDGGAGNDIVWGDGGADAIDGGEGNDELAGDDTVLSGADHGDDTINGGAGNDIIWGEGGKDILSGGDGDDTISGDYSGLAGNYHGNDTLNGGVGDDHIWGDGGADAIDGGDGDDTISGDESGLEGTYHGNDTINGGAGKDQIWGDGGADAIDGGDGDDTLNGDDSGLAGNYHGNDTINGGSGKDQIWGQGGADSIQAGDGDDYVDGDDNEHSGEFDGNDMIDGGAGKDNLWGGGGNDTIYGGAGDDSLQGDSQNDRQHDGNDKLNGGAGNDNLSGFNGNDTLDGGDGDDLLFAGNGNDVLISNAGNDQLTGGAGDDEYHIRVRNSEIKILDSAGDNHVYLEGSFNSSKISIKNYTNAASIIAPTASDDPSAIFPEFKLTFFDASTTQPTTDGGTAKDEYGETVTGGYNHYLHFTDGSSGIERTLHVETYLKEKQGLSFYTWTGSWHGVQAPYLIYTNSEVNANDQLVFDGSVIGDEIDISTIRTNTLNNGGSLADAYHLGEGDDSVEGSALGDLVFGEAGDDTIHGLGGNDTLDGGDGNDVLEGGDGDDTITGSAGNDIVDGGSGANTLYGGAGDDTLKGGSGADLITGGTGNDVLQGGAGADIYQFAQGDGTDTLIDTGVIGEESTINFTDVLPNAVELTLNQNDLIIKYGSAGQLLVKDFFINASIKAIHFADGSQWSYNDIVDQLKAITYGTVDADTITGVKIIRNEIHGLGGDDRLIGGDKADVIYGGLGNDLMDGGAGNGNQLYGEDGADTLYARGNNNLLDGGEGSDSLSISAGADNILLGGVGYDRYDISNATGTHISDTDGLGTITIDSGAVYYKFTNTGWGGITYFVDASPDIRSAQLVSRTESGGATYEQYKYTKGSHRLADLIFDTTSGQLVLHKEGASDHSSFDSYVDGFDYFKIDDVYTLSDLARIKNLKVEISGQGTRTSDNRLFTDFLSTTLSFADFIDQGTVKSIYGSGDDVIVGLTTWSGVGGDIIYAGAGNDHINTGSGSSVVYAEDGNDYIVAPDISASDEINAGAGNDTVYLYDPTLAEPPAADTLVQPFDVVHGNDGNDIVYIGNLLNAVAYGDGGDDFIQGGHNLYGGDGQDTLIAGNSNSNLDGGSGDDSLQGGHNLYGGDGQDTLTAGDSGSYLDGGAGADILYGGMGDDTFVIDDVNDQFYEDADSGYDTISIASTVDLQNNRFSMFEAVVLTGTGNFNGLGNDADNSIIGNDGDNYLDGRGGADYLEGGNGGDYYVLTAEDNYLEDGSTGTDTIERWYDTNYVLDSNIENLVLKGGAKLGFGNDLDNVITGDAQDNYIDALAGNDMIIIGSGGGTDTLAFEDDQSAVDTLRLTGISENSLIAQRFSGQDDIYFSIRGTNDHFWLYDYYKAATNNGDGTYSDSKVDRIVFDSGTVWTGTDIQTLVDRAATDRAPTVNQFPPTLKGSQGAAFSYTFAANTIIDPDVWDSVVYSLTLRTTNASGQYNAIPSWLTFDPTTRTLSGTPTSTNVGTLQFYLWGTDMYGKGTGAGVTLNITPPNAAPVVANPVPDQIFAIGASFSYTVAANAFTDPESDVLTYSMTLADGSALPAWLTFSAATRKLSGTSPDDIAAPVSVKITAIDTAGNATSDIFVLQFTLQNLTLSGTSAADTLSGGAGNDALSGLAANDLLTGKSGNDTLDGGAGTDTLTGGLGNDIYVVDATTDVITENAAEGTDTVQTTVTLTSLAANVENLTLLGTTALNGTGNSLDNLITGNSAINTLDGGLGNDTLIGGAGNDLYLVDSTSDIVTENAGEGTDTIQTSVSLTSLAANVENLTLLGTTALNATGNTLANVLTGNSAANILDGGAGTDTLIGGTGDDIYVVDSTTDVVTESASQGTDTIQTTVTLTSLVANVENLTLLGTLAINGTGNSLNNLIIGNSAVNTLDGGTGTDTLIGGAGDDIYLVDATTDVVTENAAEGTDTVQTTVTLTSLAANVENLVLLGTTAINGTGNALDNQLVGNSAANSLTGGAGNDTLNGAAGNDTLIGGLGNDVYVVDATTDVVTENASEGTDTIQSSVTITTMAANVENLILLGTTALNATGNALDNVLTGNSAANSLTGGSGNDTLIGGAGTDTLIGGLGDDVFVVDVATDVVTESASQGTDTIQSSVTITTMAANVENLILLGTTALNATGNTLNNVLTGNSAANTLDGGTGSDTLVGGAGDDLYSVDVTTDVVTENAAEGIDTIQTSVTLTSLAANVENLTLLGTTALNGTGNGLDNVLTGNSAANTLSGGAGNDSLIGAAGNDTLIGGLGDDVYTVDVTSDVVTENASEGIDTIQTTVTLATLAANVENITLLGTTALNATGNALDNVLTGNSAANSLTGGAGNDTLIGGTGNDTMLGGIGNDVYNVDATTDVVTENAAEGIDTIQTTVTLATLAANVENITLLGTTALNATGNTLDNLLMGNSAVNTLTGGAGNDTLIGGAGNDSLVGGAGNDTYLLGAGTDLDTISDVDGTAGNTDIITIAAGITGSQIWLRHVGNDLEVSVIGTNDKATISGWYTSGSNHIEQFKTSDGKKLLDSNVDNLVNAMASFTPPAAGQTTLPTNYQTSLNPVIVSNWQ